MRRRSCEWIVGPAGSGKSFLADSIVRQHPRVLIVDAGFKEYRGALSFDELGFASLVAYLERIKAFRSSVPFCVSYTPLASEHPLLFETAKELGGCLFVLEEIDRFDDPRYFQEYDDLLSRGRHYGSADQGVSLLGVGPSPIAVPKDMRRQSTRVVAFRHVDPDDIDALRRRVGPLAEQLPELPGPSGDSGPPPPYPYLDWTPGQGAHFFLAGRPWAPPRRSAEVNKVSTRQSGAPAVQSNS